MPNNGYIGRSPGDAAVIVARESFTPGAATTDFTFASGYTVGYIDCYLNGSRLIYGTDYTASNGTTVGLTSFAQSGDVIELIAYKAFNVGNVTNASGDFIVGNKLTVSGISSFTDVVSSGIITADSFSGNLTGASVSSSGPLTISDSTASTSTTTGALIVTGGVGVAKSIFVGEGISIAGTITYNDVTNIDSVGLVTAGKGLRATTGGLIVTAGVSTFAADIGGKDGVQGLNVATALKVTGVSTFVGLVTCADVVSSGIITADSYYGSGANLTGIEGGVAGVNTTGFSTFTTVSVGGISTFVGLVTAGNVVSSGIITAKAFIPNEGQLSNRNIVINGDFTVAQRGITTTSSGYGTVDRFRMDLGGPDENPTQAQVALTSSDAGPWKEGFRSCYQITNGNQTGGAGADDYCRIINYIEAQDLAKCGWDYNSPTSYITLSYWVKSSVGQAYPTQFATYDGTRMMYYFTTTLSADTWTKVTHSLPGHANISFDNNNDNGWYMTWYMFRGTNNTGTVTANQWNTYAASTLTSDQTSTWWTTNDATFQLTGVQLEVGSVATPFEHRPFRDQLLSCQRYYVRKGSPLTSIGDGGGYFTAYTQGSSNKFVGTYWYPIQLRDSPSSVEWSGIVGMYGGTCDNDGEMVATAIGNSHNCDTSSRIHLTVSSVSGGKGGLVMSKSTSGYFAWSAEL